MTDLQEPTITAAEARIASVQPDAYARTRNHLDGAVTGLSPYITHGLVTLRDVLAAVNGRHALHLQHKFVVELGWRAYFRHVWRHRGEAILQSIHDGPLPDDAYARTLPADIRQGRTGVPVIDQAVRALYATGLMHNHARLWLASYVVHVRKVHWRVGADWLYGHLLDGDLASNHLSWQWVAGTGSSKPYLFDAENVARHAPAAWHSPGSVIDMSYEALDRMAREATSAPAVPRSGTPMVGEPELRTGPPPTWGAIAPDATAVQGRDVWLVHPWSLGELPSGLPADTLVLGVAIAEFHRAWPWSDRRWAFVGSRMRELTVLRWFADAPNIGAALRGARSVRCTDEPHIARWLAQWADVSPAPALFPAIDPRCDSFSKWWSRVSKGLSTASELLALQIDRR